MSTGSVRSPPWFENGQNPNLGWLLRRGFVWSILVKSLWNVLRSKRANFGVWQLPLFNLLVLEGLDWYACLSWPGSRRWLNTWVHLKICTRRRLMMREWAYRCHLEKLETSLGDESYARLEIVDRIGDCRRWAQDAIRKDRCWGVNRTLGSVDASGKSKEMGLRCHPEGVVR